MKIHSHGSLLKGKAAPTKFSAHKVGEVVRVSWNQTCVPPCNDLASHRVRQNRELAAPKPPVLCGKISMSLIGSKQLLIEAFDALLGCWLLVSNLGLKQRQPPTFLGKCFLCSFEPPRCDAARLGPVANVVANGQ